MAVPDKKPSRAVSVMGDDERARQPRPKHDYPPTASELTALEEHDGIPEPVGDDVTPPPILVDPAGKVLSRSKRVTAYPEQRERQTVQEVIEELWPARKALPMLIEQLQRIVALETKVEDVEATSGVAALRAELVGHDGDGGMIGALTDTLRRDLADHRKIVDAVETEATKAAKFVRRVMIGAGSIVGGAILAAVAMIYQAGAHSAEGKAEVREARQENTLHIQNLERSLTDLNVQVKLLLEAQIGHHTP